MATHWVGFKGQQLEGIIINLLQSEYSKRKIRAIIPVGSARINQLRNVLKNDINTLHTRCPPHIPIHVIHGSNLDVIKANAEIWEVEDEFPCTHRYSKQYLLDVTLTFTKLHQHYKAKIEASNDGARIVSYLKWIQYVHLFYLGLRLARSTKDICDYCVRINIQFKHDDLLVDECDRLLIEKETHLDATIGQCCMVSNFVKEFIKHHVPNQPVSPTITPDHYDDEHCVDDGGDNDMTFSTVVPQIQIQIEDFGGSFAMLHYGHLRPSADYFNSNLMVSNFVVADLISNNSDVFIYDEQAQNKDVDALCSLQFTYHLEKFNTLLSRKITMPKTLLVIVDNCVGQNKSQFVM